MENSKSDVVSPEMRARLARNRDGLLTKDQWLDVVTEPLVTLLVLLAPAALLFGPRLASFSLRGGFLLLLVVLAVLGVPVFFRARRYARAAVNFGVLQAGSAPASFLLFWKPQTLYTDDGKPMRFNRRLAPFMPLRRDQAYLVYYLDDKDGLVLLSSAPCNHPDAPTWYPSNSFKSRFARRTAR